MTGNSVHSTEFETGVTTVNQPCVVRCKHACMMQDMEGNCLTMEHGLHTNGANPSSPLQA